MLLGAAIVLGASKVMALEELDDSSLSEVQGTGVAIVLNDIRLTASPTSYLEFTGADLPSNPPGLQRADIRWYGLSISGSSSDVGSTWSGSCTSGILGLGCPQGGHIKEFAPHDNPLLLRVFDYTGVDVQGNLDQLRPVFEIEYPTAHEPYRFAFWGELNVNKGSDKLQVQNIWNNVDQSGSKLQVFQHSDNNDPTFGLLFANHFSADVRMSVNQTFLSPDSLAMVPEFEDYEGLYIDDYSVYFPLGQLHYQSLIAGSTPEKDGNFVLELTAIPNIANIYNEHYGRTINDDPTGGYDRTESVRNARGSYHRTHGYLRMGDWVGTQNYGHYSVANDNPHASFGEPVGGACMEGVSTCSMNGRWDRQGGTFFVSYAGGQFTNPDIAEHYQTQPNSHGTHTESGNEISMSGINLGDSQISGMLVHQLKITTLGTQ